MSNNRNKWDGENPWLGLQTYQEGVRLWGRDTEVLTLTDIICNNLATVVFGKSGIGKSSLIHAGVSPEIRKRGMMPIYIRLEHNGNSSYTTQIENAVDNALTKKDLLGETNPQMGLWDYFHRHIFYNKDGQETFPVIIIDQFEEIYTLADADHKHLAQELFEDFADLLNNKKPEKVLAFEHDAVQFKKSKIDVGGDNVLTFRIHSERRNSYIEDSNFHVVICLREDYLYYLERNTSRIPSLKINRFSLQALDRSSACDVIMQPRPGLFSADDANGIITKISTFNDEGKEEIDPTILSIFLFKYFNRKGNVSTDNIISEFYTDETKNISSIALAYLEDHLITGEGFRHFSPYNDALSNGVTKQELEQLITSRILTVETRKGHRYIEFSHDVICPIAKSNREQRKIDEQARKLRKRILAATGLVFLAIILIGSFLYLHYNLRQSERSLQVSKTKNASIRAHYMIVQGDVLDAIKLLLNIVPEEEGPAILSETEKALNEAYDSLYSDYSCIAVLNHQDDVTTAEFSDDAKSIITACSDGVCRIWNGMSGELQKELKIENKNMTGASLNKKGDRAIASFSDGSVTIWNVETSETVATIKGHASAVNYACFSSDGQLVLTSSNDCTVNLWNANSGEFIETIVVHEDEVNCALFSTDGKKVITSSEDGSAILYNLDSHQSIEVFKDKNVSVEYAEFSFDDSMIAIVTNTNVYILDAKTYKTIATLSGHKDLITSATFSPDGKTVATSSHDKTIKLWDIQKGTVIHTYKGHSNNVRDVVFSPNGKFILSTSSDNEARLWNAGGNDRSDIIRCNMGILRMLTYSPNGKFIAAISGTGKAQIWDVSSKNIVSTFSIPERAHSITFNSESNLVVVTSETNCLRVFDVTSGNLVDSIEADADSYFENALFTDNDKMIIAYSRENRTISWECDKHIFKYMDGSGMDSLTCINLLPNETAYLLSSASKNSFFVWNITQNEISKEFNGHAAEVSYVSCSHNGERIISASSDNSAFIWDMKTGNILYKLKRHSSQVYFAEFSPDDQYAITASTDGTVKLWNAITGAEVATRSNTWSTQYKNIFNANGKNYIVSFNGEDIRIYKHLSPQELIDEFRVRYDNVQFTTEEKELYSL